MMDRKTMIQSYFESWLIQDRTIWPEIFSHDITYYECYGPYYRGLEQILKWFDEWIRFGKVIVWDIHDYMECGNKSIVTWYFQTLYDGDEDAFEGVSLITFNEFGRICEVREYQSTLPHVEITMK